MVDEKVTDRHSSFTLGIKVPGVIRDGEFTSQDLKTFSIPRKPKFNHEFFISTRENSNYCLLLTPRWQSFRFYF